MDVDMIKVEMRVTETLERAEIVEMTEEEFKELKDLYDTQEYFKMDSYIGKRLSNGFGNLIRAGFQDSEFELID